VHAVRTVTHAAEDFNEQKRLPGCGPSGVRRSEKGKFEDSRRAIAAKLVKQRSSGKEKVDYKALKAGERKVKKEGSVARTGEVRHAVWAPAHKGDD